ncbi:ATP-dependent DNA ligase [Gemmatimonas phototrophica]|uniref:DNA ligase (ATP) n=1 Tax=Gemmatimonas phototrophica TaxID=1379270 RepID=A0A143BM05_9BACT|nr:ATP-dependent DNA ligase [Gemmatimonas phototrophica]AMW06077.1 ATP-dependent DNA ligase [Gemmatimonas phototrophica]
MQQFAALYDAIDESTATNHKVAALVAYFREAPPADAAWAAAFLLGRRPKRLVKAPHLRSWAATAAGVPDWLFEECYAQAGDLAETMALLVPHGHTLNDESFTWWVETQLLPLAQCEPDEQHQRLLTAWSTLGGSARFVFNKLLTGAFRVGVSDGLVVRALAQMSGVPAETIAHRLMGEWEPTAAWYTQLIGTETTDADWSRPYPFFLAHPLEGPAESLGDVHDWQVEWKWDGIRCQLVRRRGRTFLWSRGEELLAGRFPEVEASAEWLPDGTVLDGELLAWRDEQPLPFAELQKRINRRTVGKKLLADVPCHLLVYDCLEAQGTDVRALPMTDRRQQAEQVVRALPGGARIGLSPVIAADTWEAVSAARLEARRAQAEGLMLKRVTSAYGVGRKMGEWYKWKVNPLTVDAVLVYAQAGHGRRAGLYTDYTFAIWDGDTLVPFAKAYSGLTDAEIRQVDRFIRANTIEKFGPVRTVKAELVFELAFEGIQRSPRHKSGIAVRFSRIARWRQDKPSQEADTLATVKALLDA